MAQIQLNQISEAGPTVIFIHGFLGNSLQWRPVIQPIKDQFAVYTVDLPGHGNNNSLDPYMLTDIAKDIVRALNDLDIDLVHIVGHSMGGYVGSAFAKAHPEKVASLTLLNSIASVDSDERLDLRQRSLHFIDRYGHAYTTMAISNLFTDLEKVTHAEKIENLKIEATKMDLKAIKNAIKAMKDRTDALHMIKEHEVNLHYIAGLQDTIIPISQIRTEAAQLHKPVDEIDSGHMSLITSPELITQYLPFIE